MEKRSVFEEVEKKEKEDYFGKYGIEETWETPPPEIEIQEFEFEAPQKLTDKEVEREIDLLLSTALSYILTLYEVPHYHTKLNRYALTLVADDVMVEVGRDYESNVFDSRVILKRG